MKPLLTIIALTLLAGVGLAAVAQGGGTTYTSPVVGDEVNTGNSNVIVLHGKAKESLPGVYHITIRFNPETKEITGGDWVRTVLRQEVDGSQSEVGTLHGNVAGGTVTVNADGRVMAINAATITIAGGNKDYSGVANGSGLFEGSLQIEGGIPAPQHGPGPAQEGSQAPVAPLPSASAETGPRPNFNGKMTLNF